MRNTLRLLLISALAAFVSGCVGQNSLSTVRVANLDLAVAMNVNDCRSLLSRAADESADQLDPTSIGLLNWNIKKGTGEAWQDDLGEMSIGKELVILQEAVLGTGIENHLDGVSFVSFSPGFTTKSRMSGVATYSSSKPLNRCHLSVIEPVLRTRKATSVTEFGLAGTEQTLVVVNVHAINFSLGLGRFRDQMEQIREVLQAHSGPAILSGDFNTWRRKRLDIVDELASELDFSAVFFDDDNRKTFNGNALDHVFVRGLFVESSETKPVDSSDHNPLSVELRL